MQKIYKACSVSGFKFRTTKDLKPNYDIIAQSRAKKAIQLGLGISRPGYNIFVSGVEGTGRTSVIQQQLELWAKKQPVPEDWLYLYNFKDAECPLAVSLPAGEGKKFKKAMDQLVKAFKKRIPSALQSEDYENAVNTYISNMNDRKSKLFSDLEKLAKSMEFVVKSSRMGIETIPIYEGRPLTEKDYSKLPEASREEIENQRGKLEPEVLDFARKVRAIEQDTRNAVEELRMEIGEQIISGLMEPIYEQFGHHPSVSEYLEEAKEHAIENLLEFVEEEESEDEPHEPRMDDRQRFNKYKVNLFIDQSATKHAPVVIETNPTYYNLFGKIEKNVEHGMYHTDFTMVKSGAIHRANGGYLVLNVLDIFRHGSIWDTLKRILRNRTSYIEDMGEQYSLLPTSGLRPAPIPLHMKVILIGNDELYHLLFSEDEEFHKIFKVKADFDWKMDRSAKNVSSYVSFVATRAHMEGLLPFDRSGVAAVVEYGSRLVEDQRLLSTRFGEIKDLTIEADYFARQEGARQVKRAHIEEALQEKFLRLNLHEQNLLELVKSRDILISVKGEVIGQINGLAVYDYGDYAFGKIGRITCTTAISDNGIINIERASHLSGKIHDKGVYILTGFIHAILAQKRRMGLAASVCFEQSYGIIDGDSASAAELIAILSAMAGLPVKQHMAITGSVNQMGEIQSVGGVNEKIEGFFKTCVVLEPEGEFAVLVPAGNVPNLMLHSEVRDAVKEGTLQIYAISYIWEAFEIMTGVPLGAKKVHNVESFPEGSALAIIDQKLERIHQDEEDTHESSPDASLKTKEPVKKRARARHG